MRHAKITKSWKDKHCGQRGDIGGKKSTGMLALNVWQMLGSLCVELLCVKVCVCWCAIKGSSLEAAGN